MTEDLTIADRLGSELAATLVDGRRRLDPAHHVLDEEDDGKFEQLPDLEETDLQPTAPRPRPRLAAAFAPALRPARRSEPRYEAVQDRIWIQWWRHGEFNGQAGRLVNVSRHGAMFVAAERFVEGQPMRIFLEEPLPRHAVDARVLGLVEGKGGLNRVRVKFLEPCPDAFFVAAANGFEAWLARDRSRV